MCEDLMAMDSPALTTGPVKTQLLAILWSVLGGCRRGFKRLTKDLRHSCEDEQQIVKAESFEGLSLLTIYQLLLDVFQV